MSEDDAADRAVDGFFAPRRAMAAEQAKARMAARQQERERLESDMRRDAERQKQLKASIYGRKWGE
jgi:hypothetical protein